MLNEHLSRVMKDAKSVKSVSQCTGRQCFLECRVPPRTAGWSLEHTLTHLPHLLPRVKPQVGSSDAIQTLVIVFSKCPYDRVKSVFFLLQ